MAQQTAVEWLTEQVKSKEWQDMFIWHKEEVFKQAKAMEKEQILDSYSSGAWYESQNIEKYAEQYYNETYGSNN